MSQSQSACLDPISDHENDTHDWIEWAFDGERRSSDVDEEDGEIDDEDEEIENECDSDLDDSDVDGEMGVRALAFDPNQLSHSNGLPVNGHDYLKLVQKERERLPAVVTVPPPASARKSTQTIPMEVLHCDDEIPNNQENPMPSQQSSLHPMETSILRESHSPSPSPSSSSSSSSSSSLSLSNGEKDDNLLAGNHNISVYSGMASKEFREQIRLKSIGCTPLNLERRGSRHSESAPSTSNSERDLLHRDEILANFLKLRAQIDSVRGHNGSNPGEICDINGDDDEPKQQKSGKRADKNLSRCDRRVASLIRIMNLGHPPQLSTLLHKSQRVIHVTLERLADQCERAPIYSTLHADWIYSLISLLREPIEPDICSTLRRLAKLCINRRDNYERRAKTTTSGNGASSHQLGAAPESRDLVDAVNDEEYYACLLIICIVRYHFGQADLK